MIKNNININYQNLTLNSLIIGLSFVACPLLVGIYQDEILNIAKDEEYVTMFKIIIFSSCLAWYFEFEKYRELFLNSIIIFYNFLGCYFLYRYLILHEVREYDLRPQLHIRHGDANFLCAFFSMMVPMPLLQAWKAHNKHQQLLQYIFILSSFILIFCAYLTESRMGIIALVIGCLYLIKKIVWPHSNRFILSLIMSTILLVFLFTGERVQKRFGEIADKSNSDRFLTWENGIKVFINNPIIGIGIHKAKDTYYQNTQYPPFQSESKQLEVHNTFLQIASETGIVGLFFFLFLFLRPWIIALKIKSDEKYFLLSSMIILSLSMLTIGIGYKDLFILHIFILTALAHNYKRALLCN
jgi:O-antigen ligase